MKNGLQALLMISAISGLLLTKPALATDEVDWTGVHIAGGLGYGMLNQNAYVTESSVPITAKETSGGKGMMGRLGVGYNYQWRSRVVVGAFADFDLMNISGRHDFPGLVGREKQSSTWYLGGLAGFTLTPLTLLFIDAGYTNTHLKKVHYAIAIAGGSGSDLTLASHNYSGWFLGLGMETLIAACKSSNLFLRTEYRFSDYGAASIPLSGDVADITVGGAAERSRVYGQTATLSLRWAFLRT